MATQYAPAPASLTIISCKYENRQRLQVTTEFAKRQKTTTTRKISTVLFYQVCADTVKAKHSRIWAQAMPFLPIKQVTFDILTLKVMSESRVTWATSVPILVFPRLSVLDLRPMYATDRQTDVRQTSDAHHRLMPPPYRAGP